MLDMLLESGPKSRRATRPRDAAVSVVFHALAIVGAVVATAPAAHRLATAVGEARLVFVPQAPPPIASQPVPPSVQLPSASSPSWSFSVPTVVLPTIPAIDPGAARSTEPVIGATPVSPAGTGFSPIAGQIFQPDQVERPVVPYPDNAAPHYPSVLQSAAVEGEVVAQFVVDTLGRVEPASVRILRSTHDLFERAVRDALARARFHPAQIGGLRVRQLVEQRFAFSLRTP